MKVSSFPCLAICVAAFGCGPSTLGGRCGGDPDACVAYCAHVVAAGCELPMNAMQVCVDSCHQDAMSVPGDCMNAWTTALGCASCATVQCPTRTCLDGGGVCIQEGGKILGCDSESAAFRVCGGSCLLSSVDVVGGGSAGATSYDLRTSRCACPSTLASGGGAGTACATSADCAETCCACGTGQGRYVLRVCENGQCLGAPDVCSPDAIPGSTTIGSFCAG